MARSTQTIAALNVTAAHKEDSMKAQIAELQALKDTLRASFAAAEERAATDAANRKVLEERAQGLPEPAEELEAELKVAVESGRAAEAGWEDKFRARCARARAPPALSRATPALARATPALALAVASVTAATNLLASREARTLSLTGHRRASSAASQQTAPSTTRTLTVRARTEAVLTSERSSCSWASP